jgi:ribonuclease D
MIYNRDVVLVVHVGHQDLWFLKELNIDLQPIAILDTQKAAQQPLQLCRRYSLEELLVAFNYLFKFLHTAGNDANFTLRAQCI